MNINAHSRGHLAMLLFSLLIAGSFSFGTRVANMMDPAALMALRFAISGCVVGALAFLTTGFKRSNFRAPWRYLILGGLFAIYFALMFEGLKTAGAVSAAAVFTLTPAMSAVFGYFILRQLINKRMALALLVGAIGAVLVIFRGDISAMLGFNVGRGEQIYFVACIAHALYTPLVRKFNRGEPTLVFTFGTIVAGSLFLFLLGSDNLAQTDFAALPSLFWIALLYLAICASSMTFFLLQYASMNLPSANVMSYTYLTPIWVTFVEMVFAGAAPNSVVWLGILLTIIALLMLLKKT